MWQRDTRKVRPGGQQLYCGDCVRVYVREVFFFFSSSSRSVLCVFPRNDAGASRAYWHYAQRHKTSKNTEKRTCTTEHSKKITTCYDDVCAFVLYFVCVMMRVFADMDGFA